MLIFVKNEVFFVKKLGLILILNFTVNFRKKFRVNFRKKIRVNFCKKTKVNFNLKFRVNFCKNLGYKLRLIFIKH